MKRSKYDKATIKCSIEPHPDNNDSFGLPPRSLRGSLRSTPEYNEYPNLSSKSSRGSLRSTPRTPRCQSYDEYNCADNTFESARHYVEQEILDVLASDVTCLK